MIPLIKNIDAKKSLVLILALIFLDQVVKFYIKLNYPLTIFGELPIIDIGFFKLLFIEASPSPCKYLLEKLSLLENNLRLPLHPLSVEYREKIYEVFKNI